MRLPRLGKTDTETLFTVYYGQEIITAKEIVENFGISKTSAQGIIRYILSTRDEYCPQSGIRYIPVDWLFDVYHIDPKEVARKYKILQRSE